MYSDVSSFLPYICSASANSRLPSHQDRPSPLLLTETGVLCQPEGHHWTFTGWYEQNKIIPIVNLFLSSGIGTRSAATPHLISGQTQVNYHGFKPCT